MGQPLPARVVDERFVSVAWSLDDTTRDPLLMLDIDGVLVHEEHALAGAAGFLQRARRTRQAVPRFIRPMTWPPA